MPAILLPSSTTRALRAGMETPTATPTNRITQKISEKLVHREMSKNPTTLVAPPVDCDPSAT